MRKKIVVRGPVLTRSGYGEQTRFALRALRKYENLFDIYLIPVGWGNTGWVADDDEERAWIDSIVGKTIVDRERGGGNYDISLQVTIPQEWEKLAPVNIGYTAGTETTKISPQWIQRSNMMDRIIAVSNHTKAAFKNSSHDVVNEQGDEIKDYKCSTPVRVVNFATRNFEAGEIDLESVEVGSPCDFNFLTVAQWSPRKNLENTIEWFVEEFKDEEVGLIVKVNLANNSIGDSEICRRKLKNLLNKYKGSRKCKVYLLHGELTDGQLTALYRSPKIKALVNLAHGEGFGLPMFEAAQSGLPVIAANWSGHTDFLYAPHKDKNTGKTKRASHFATVEYTIQPIQDEAIWEPVLIQNSMWCYPQKISYQKKLRDVYTNHGKWKKTAEKLQKHIAKNFSEEKQYKRFAEYVLGEKVDLEEAKYVFVSDMFANQYIGGAEMSLQTLIEETKDSYTTVNSAGVTKEMIEFYKDSKWVFGNYADLETTRMEQIINKKLDYSIVEFDYKFCLYRNLELHETMENSPCNCTTREKGQLVERFLAAASNVFFMSNKQMEIHLEHLDSLNKDNCVVLSSVFEKETIEKLKKLRKENTDKKQDFWAVSGSPHWVKNAEAAKKWCAEKEVDYVELNNLPYDDALQILATAKGLCFLPAGADTCPRLVIEAKLLGCELELNENVQHTEEDWFKTDNLTETEEYLTSVTDRFWQKLVS